MTITHIHVPKTGGSSIFAALPQVTHWGHHYAIREPSPERAYITTVRDPLRRFASACGFTHSTPPDIDWDSLMFLPQVNWLESADRLHEPDVLWVGNTDTLSQDWPRLTAIVGPAALPHLRRSDHGDMREWEPLVRERYAADYAMLEAL